MVGRCTPLGAALHYQSLGLSVIPVQPNGKRPLVPWKRFQTKLAPESQLKAWWKTWPRARIGLVTGTVSDLVVVDIDDSRQEATDQTVAAFGGTGRVARTPSGGAHLYYRRGSEPLRNATRLADFDFAVDIRGDGGYVVAPPSPGYRWERDAPFSSLATLARPPSVATPVVLPSASETVGAGEAGGDLIPEGHRNSTLASLGGTMRRRGMTEQAIAVALDAVNQRRCRPILPKTEVHAIAASIGRYPSGTSRANGAFRASSHSRGSWPAPLDQVALHGPAGEFVRVVEPHTEGDPAALLVQMLVAFGNLVGRIPHFRVEADHHYPNLFAGIVGETSKARKGVSLGRVRDVSRRCDPTWDEEHTPSGLSSGEGLIWHVRDAGQDHAGVADKRRLIIESELASTLRVLGRDGNTLSAVIREAWDSGNLQSLTKNSAAKATGAHVSIIGHITADELRRYLDRTEIGNGFANRFLWVCVRRSKMLPEGGNLDDKALEPVVDSLVKAREFAASVGKLSRDEEALALWRGVYPDLSEGRPGLLGAVTSRAEAQVMRLALVYALLDQSPLIRCAHLEAALEVWRYSFDSAAFIFSDSLGNPVADEILRALRLTREGLTRDEIRNLFQRHKKSAQISDALDLLARQGLAYLKQEKTGGRPAGRWYATESAGCAVSAEGAKRSAL